VGGIDCAARRRPATTALAASSGNVTTRSLVARRVNQASAATPESELRVALASPYQAVRNVAAALSLADDGQLAVLALIYDADNPYFAGV